MRGCTQLHHVLLSWHICIHAHLSTAIGVSMGPE